MVRFESCLRTTANTRRGAYIYMSFADYAGESSARVSVLCSHLMLHSVLTLSLRAVYPTVLSTIVSQASANDIGLVIKRNRRST